MSGNKQQSGINSWRITPVKSVFSWTQSKELLSAELYKSLQRAVSPTDRLFVGNADLFQKNNPKHNRALYQEFLSYVEIDPEKLPPRFLEVFDLDSKDPDIQSKVEALFQRARLLDKHSARVLFVDDKIIIFRNEERLVHKNETRKLTQGEKRRTEIKTTFNTFDNLYDAIRSQYYAIEWSEEKKDDYKQLQKDILTLAQDIRVSGYWEKDAEFQRKLTDIVSQIEHATNAKILAANLQNLQALTTTNKSVDFNLLHGAKNKFTKRFQDLQSIISVIERQLNDMENILAQHESALNIFLNQITFANPELCINNYTNAIRTIPEEFRQVSPFSDFNNAINHAINHVYKNSPTWLKDIAEEIKKLYNEYTSEHTEKLNLSK